LDKARSKTNADAQAGPIVDEKRFHSGANETGVDQIAPARTGSVEPEQQISASIRQPVTRRRRLRPLRWPGPHPRNAITERWHKAYNLNFPDRSSRESTRTLCKHFAGVSPDMSGHECQTDRAPMLVGTPLPVILSVFVALGLALWTVSRRGVSRAVHGRVEGMCGVLGGNGVATEERPRGEDALSISFPVVRRKCGSRSSLTAPLPGEQTMARVRVHNFTISLDGYGAG